MLEPKPISEMTLEELISFTEQLRAKREVLRAENIKKKEEKNEDPKPRQRRAKPVSEEDQMMKEILGL